MNFQFTARTGVAIFKGVPPANVMSPWSGGPGIPKFAVAASLITVQLTANKGAVPAKVVPPRRHHLPGGLFYLKKSPLVRGWGYPY